MDSGAEVDVFCYWSSRCGHGGPTLSPTQMKGLAELGLDLGLDIYSATRVTTRIGES